MVFSWLNLIKESPLNSFLLSTSLAHLTTYPFSTVIRRMQVQVTHSTMQSDHPQMMDTNYRNSWHCLKDIVTTQGLRGLYRGFACYSVVHAFTIALMVQINLRSGFFTPFWPNVDTVSYVNLLISMMLRQPVNTFKRLASLVGCGFSETQKPLTTTAVADNTVSTKYTTCEHTVHTFTSRNNLWSSYKVGACSTATGSTCGQTGTYTPTCPFRWYTSLSSSNAILVQSILSLVFLTMPAALPLMFVVECLLLRRFFLKQVRYRPIVEEINLLDCGTMIEVKYANSLTRKLKNLPLEVCYSVDALDKVREADEDPIL